MIELKNISKVYKMGVEMVHALDDVSLKVNDGEFVAIIGPRAAARAP